MPRTCAVCHDKRRKEIDARLFNMEISKDTYRCLSSEFQIHEATLRRHRKNCLVEYQADVLQTMQQAREKALEAIRIEEIEDIKTNAATTISGRLEQARDVFDQLKILRDRAGSLLDQAETSEDLRSAGIFLRELREQLKLLAELEGRIQSQPQVNILLDPEWVQLRTLILQTLQPYPDALEALIDALP